MNKAVALKTKQGRRAVGVSRPVTDKSAPARATIADTVVPAAGISISSPGPGFKELNKGGYRAFKPGPAARFHTNPFGIRPEVAYQFWSVR